MTGHEIVDHDAWLTARREFLAKEKEFTHARDALTKARQALPWEKVEKKYVFDGPGGQMELADLFGGRSQLVVYHFMFGPDATAGCKACSFWADNFERNVVHLAHRDVTLVAISRGPIDKLLAFQKRLGWSFQWVSSGRSDFNFDFGVSFEPSRSESTYNYVPKSFGGNEMPGISVFCKDSDGTIYHTYSTYGRGLDMMNAAYHYLDIVPKGRDEEALSFSMAWLRYRDAYDDGS
jgi:predicted dithiol-disulfide oxidoreductase (DUF899 family)